MNINSNVNNSYPREISLPASEAAIKMQKDSVYSDEYKTTIEQSFELLNQQGSSAEIKNIADRVFSVIENEVSHIKDKKTALEGQVKEFEKEKEKAEKNIQMLSDELEDLTGEETDIKEREKLLDQEAKKLQAIQSEEKKLTQAAADFSTYLDRIDLTKKQFQEKVKLKQQEVFHPEPVKNKTHEKPAASQRHDLSIRERIFLSEEVSLLQQLTPDDRNLYRQIKKDLQLDFPEEKALNSVLAATVMLLLKGKIKTWTDISQNQDVKRFKVELKQKKMEGLISEFSVGKFYLRLETSMELEFDKSKKAMKIVKKSPAVFFKTMLFSKDLANLKKINIDKEGKILSKFKLFAEELISKLISKESFDEFKKEQNMARDLSEVTLALETIQWPPEAKGKG